jgi:hypothetical protein
MDGIDSLTAGDPVTAEQMRASFGCDLHPLAGLRQQQLEGPDLIPRVFQELAQLGALRVVDAMSARLSKSQIQKPHGSSMMTKGRLTRGSNGGA